MGLWNKGMSEVSSRYVLKGDETLRIIFYNPDLF